MKERITQTVQKALQGSRKVKITFKSSATYDDVHSLLEMNNNNFISLVEGEVRMLIYNVSTDAVWKFDYNRDITVILTSNFKKDWFISRMYRALEKIEVVG